MGERSDLRSVRWRRALHDELQLPGGSERGLTLAASSGVHVRDFFLLTQGIFCALAEEDWPRAKRHLNELARMERDHLRLDAMVHHFFRSWYSLCRGDPAPPWHTVGARPARLHSGDVDAFCNGAEIARAKRDDERFAKQVERMLIAKALGGAGLADAGARSRARWARGGARRRRRRAREAGPEAAD